MKITANTAKGEKVIGELLGEAFSRNVTNASFLRQPPAYAISLSSLEKIERNGGKQFILTNTESGAVLTCSIATMRAHGFAQDRTGGDMQWITPLTWWNVTQADTGAAAETTTPAPDYRQLTLGGAK